MNSKKLRLITIVLLIGLTIPFESVAQNTRYIVRDLGTLGGTFSIAFAINNKGAIDGLSNTLGDNAEHGFFWRKGVMTDLGTLGGINSIARDRLNERDQIAGRAETSVSDPLGEDFCLTGTGLVCLPFLWTNGVMTPLPTLGRNGAAHAVNNRGQVVGLAETLTPDPTCTPPQVLQFKPVFWQRGRIHQLPTFAGDADGLAVVINDRGQAAGASGDCTVISRHALLWQKGVAIDLGTLGGPTALPQAINNQGQIVGNSSLAGGGGHGFLWQNGVMSDLGTLPGDNVSAVFGINSKAQVVGVSCNPGGCLPIIWQNGVMTDLTTLVAADSELIIDTPRGINDRGEIVGAGVDPNSGEVHAFLAVPQNGEVAGPTTATARTRVKKALPANIRKLLRLYPHNDIGIWPRK